MDGWTIGFAIGAVVALVVVALLLVLIALAGRIGGRAEAILGALQATHRNTGGLGELWSTNRTLDRITQAARRAREHLEGGAR